MASEIEVNVNQNNNQVNLTQNVTNTVEVKSLGPKGDKGDRGETGATGPVYEPTGSLRITGSLTVSSSFVDFTNSTAISGSTFSGSFVGDGSGLTNVISVTSSLSTNSNNVFVDFGTTDLVSRIPIITSTSDGFTQLKNSSNSILYYYRTTNPVTGTSNSNDYIYIGGGQNTAGGIFLNSTVSVENFIYSDFGTFHIKADDRFGANNPTYPAVLSLSTYRGSDSKILLDSTLVDISSSVSITGSLNISSSLTAVGITYPTTDGDNGDIIYTNGSGVLTFDKTKVYANVKNISGTTLQKGTPVHVVSSVGNLDEVIAASASNPSTMPATFVLSETLVDDQEGLGILTGFINGVDTRGFSEGQVVYVGANGGYTNQKPSGSNLIQNLGIVTKVAENGSGFIYGSGRANDTPNLLQGNIFFGSGSNQQYQTHLSSAIDLTTLNNITASGNISSSGTVYGVTGSFSHLVGNSPITIGSPVTFTQVITGSVFSGSFVGDGSGLSGISGGGSGIFNLTGSVYATTNDLQITGSLIVDNGGSDTFIVDGSGSTIFEIRGSEGTLFQITDSLSGSLFSVSDISGFPQFEVFSDGQILFGWSPQSLYTTAKIESTTAATTQSIYSISTSSYDGAFFEYTVTSASNMRAGTISAIWEAGGTNINYSDVSTLDIGSTSGVDLLVNISQSKAHLQSITDTSSWKIKTIIRSI